VIQKSRHRLRRGYVLSRKAAVGRSSKAFEYDGFITLSFEEYRHNGAGDTAPNYANSRRCHSAIRCSEKYEAP
jgi:hypothetical protein